MDKKFFLIFIEKNASKLPFCIRKQETINET